MKLGEYLYILICILLYFPIKHFIKKTNSYVLFSILFVMVLSMYVFPLSKIRIAIYNPSTFSNFVVFLFALFTIYLIFIFYKDAANKKVIKFICKNIENIFYPSAIGTPFLEQCEYYYDQFFSYSVLYRHKKSYIHPDVYVIKNNRTLGNFINFTYAIIAIDSLTTKDYYRYQVVKYCLLHIDDMNLRYFKNVYRWFDELHNSRPDRIYMFRYEEVEKAFLREYIMFFARDEEGHISQTVYNRVLHNFPPEYSETINYVRNELKRIQTENQK